jgi:hypothetical protein
MNCKLLNCAAFNILVIANITACKTTKCIEAIRELMKSPNTKVIIADNKTMMVNNLGDK